MSYLLGIDVSHHQSNIDWTRVSRANYKFCFCRATYGTREDRTFAGHFNSARNAGLLAGAYHFLRFKPRMSAEAQAEAFLETLNDAGALAGEMLPPVLDLEDNRTYDELIDTAAERRAYLDMTMKWLDIVEEELGRRVMIYINPSFANHLRNPAALGIRPLWIAHYTTRPSPRIPEPWSRYTFWQFTESGNVDGIATPADVNRFEGSTDDLTRLTEVSGSPVRHPGLTPFAEDRDEDVEVVHPLPEVRGSISHVIPGGLNIRSEPRVADHTRIDTLPMAHPVEVLESGIEGKWSKVITTINNQVIEGFVSGQYLRPPVSATREALIAQAVKEWLRFQRGQGKETQDPYYKYVGEMWQALDRNEDGRDTSVYWSAAFISFVVRNAGTAYQSFKFSARHSTYIHDAIVSKERGEAAPFWGYRLNEYSPQLGDMIAQWRVHSRTYNQARDQDNFPSHVDIVVGLTNKYAVTLGGNVSNSVSLKETTYELDGGFLKPVNRTFAVLENRTG